MQTLLQARLDYHVLDLTARSWSRQLRCGDPGTTTVYLPVGGTATDDATSGICVSTGNTRGICVSTGNFSSTSSGHSGYGIAAIEAEALRLRTACVELGKRSVARPAGSLPYRQLFAELHSFARGVGSIKRVTALAVVLGSSTGEGGVAAGACSHNTIELSTHMRFSRSSLEQALQTIVL